MSKLLYLVLASLLVVGPGAFASETSQEKPALAAAVNKDDVKVLTDEEVAALVTSWTDKDSGKTIQLSAQLRTKPNGFQLTSSLTQRKPKHARIGTGQGLIYVLDSDGRKVLQAKVSLAKLVPC